MSQTKTIENHIGYKETKLGWIPKDWEIVRLEEVGDTITGLTYNPKMIDDNGILVLRSSNVQDRVLKYDDNVFVSVNKGSYNPTKNGDILICVRNGSRNLIGKNAIITEDKSGTAFGAFMLVFRSSDYKYLYQLFDTDYYNNEIHRNLGATINSINTNNLKKFRFPYPKEEEERSSIANCLSTWDTSITKQTQLIKAKQQQKKALAQQLLTGKKRLKGFSEEWKEKRLSNFIEYTPRAVEKPQEAFTKLGIRSHCKGTFQNQNFEPTNIAITTLFEVKPRDLIVNITFAWEGAIAIVKEKDNGALVSHRFPTYVFKENISSYLFFEQFIKTKKFRYLLELISPGGAGRNRVMSKKEFIKLKINIPEYEEQTAIAQILTTADKEITLLQQQLMQLKLQKKGVMQQLLTGKKRLKV